MKICGSKNRIIPGFGFLVLSDEFEVREALREKKFYFKGRYLRAEPYLESGSLKKHKNDLQRRRVFIGRIPPSMGDYELKEVLQAAVGPVENAYGVVNCHTGRHQGFGYATFERKEDAVRAQELRFVFVEAWGVKLSLEKVKGKKNGAPDGGGEGGSRRSEFGLSGVEGCSEGAEEPGLGSSGAGNNEKLSLGEVLEGGDFGLEIDPDYPSIPINSNRALGLTPKSISSARKALKSAGKVFLSESKKSGLKQKNGVLGEQEGYSCSDSVHRKRTGTRDRFGSDSYGLYAEKMPTRNLRASALENIKPGDFKAEDGQEDRLEMPLRVEIAQGVSETHKNSKKSKKFETPKISNFLSNNPNNEHNKLIDDSQHAEASQKEPKDMILGQEEPECRNPAKPKDKDSTPFPRLRNLEIRRNASGSTPNLSPDSLQPPIYNNFGQLVQKNQIFTNMGYGFKGSRQYLQTIHKQHPGPGFHRPCPSNCPNHHSRQQNRENRYWPSRRALMTKMDHSGQNTRLNYGAYARTSQLRSPLSVWGF